MLEQLVASFIPAVLGNTVPTVLAPNTYRYTALAISTFLTASSITDILSTVLALVLGLLLGFKEFNNFEDEFSKLFHPVRASALPFVLEEDAAAPDTSILGIIYTVAFWYVYLTQTALSWYSSLAAPAILVLAAFNGTSTAGWGSWMLYVKYAFGIVSIAELSLMAVYVGAIAFLLTGQNIGLLMFDQWWVLIQQGWY